jgi:hypothetical protein
MQRQHFPEGLFQARKKGGISDMEPGLVGLIGVATSLDGGLTRLYQ